MMNSIRVISKNQIYLTLKMIFLVEGKHNNTINSWIGNKKVRKI